MREEVGKGGKKDEGEHKWKRRYRREMGGWAWPVFQNTLKLMETNTST
jgi:hypothetical protein